MDNLQDAAQHSDEGLTAKESWWAGYRAGKGLPPDTPRREAVELPPAPSGLSGCSGYVTVAEGQLLKPSRHIPDGTYALIARDALETDAPSERQPEPCAKCGAGWKPHVCSPGAGWD